MQDMNDDYANGAYIPGAADYPLVWSKAAAAFRERLGPASSVGNILWTVEPHGI